MNRPRKQTYTMDMFLNKIKDMDIRNDSDTQRQFVWSNEQINELIVTVLTEDYIPPIILAEVDNSQLWIVDGGQRSSSFIQFRYGNYKITSAIGNSVIPYKKKIIDEQGNIMWQDESFDIKNKTYEKLPEELKKKFNEYQIETAIHEACDTRRIAMLIKRYNNHTSMNCNQKAFTYIDNYAREVRDILDSKFFLECGVYTEKERNKGVLERVVLESIMCMFHFDNWKKQPKQVAGYLNENATNVEFNQFNSYIKRLEKVITEDLKSLFSSKDSFIWFSLFNIFSKFSIDDSRFAEFLRVFKNELKDKDFKGVSYTELDKNRGTKDRAVISVKLEHLTSLLCEFLGINQDITIINAVEDFVQNNVCEEIRKEDIELYEEILNDLTIGFDDKILIYNNKPSLIGIVAYACFMDIDLDECFKDLLSNINLSKDQTANYINMKERLGEFVNVSDN